VARASYHGPVHTLEHALLADLPVRVTCTECSHFRQMHAFELTQKVSRNPRLRILNLWEPVPGFRCGQCGRSVRVVVSAPFKEAR
jgi:hypothetical protein